MSGKISIGEDLMREHGILARLLLIYEEIDARLLENDFQMERLRQSAQIMQRYIHDYHEKVEEEIVFPIFRKESRLVTYTEILKEQHDVARTITKEVLDISAQPQPDDPAIERLIDRMDEFILMYRPHMAKEDTLLFPELQELVGDEEYMKLDEQDEEMEHRILGEDAFKKIRDEVTEIEKALEIYDISIYTPEE